jgi:D-Tyr-tRNAtyr deacylase
MSGQSTSKGALVKLVIQQCVSASITLPNCQDLESEEVRSIGKGVVVFVCFLRGSSVDSSKAAADTVCSLPLSTCDEAEAAAKRVSVAALPGDVLIVPQATLGGKWKGRSMGEELFSAFSSRVKELVAPGRTVVCGAYGATQKISMDCSCGPYTHVIEL